MEPREVVNLVGFKDKNQRNITGHTRHSNQVTKNKKTHSSRTPAPETDPIKFSRRKFKTLRKKKNEVR